MYSAYTVELAVAGSNAAPQSWPGGKGLFLSKNIGSPATLEFSIDGGTVWHSLLSTAASPQSFELPNCLVQTTGGGLPLDAWLVRV